MRTPCRVLKICQLLFKKVRLAVSAPLRLLLTIEREVVAVFANDNVGEQSGGGGAAVLKDVQRGGDRWRGGIAAADILAPDEPAAHEARGRNVELAGDFLANAAPLCGLRAHDVRNYDFLFDGQVLREAGTAFLAAARGVFGGDGLQRVTGGGHAGGRRFSRGGFSFHAGEQQFELGGIELFALCSKDAPHQQVDLLPQQFGFLLLRRDPL